MVPQSTETLPIRVSSDIVIVRQVVRARAAEIGLSLVDQTKIVTAASELARNTLEYGQGGECQVEVLNSTGRAGLRLSFSDKGPGIPDITVAMRDGFTTGNGLGLGLSGSKRLVNDFEIATKVGEGTRVTVTRWK